jgi:UDP-galactopyranose mutase
VGEGADAELVKRYERLANRVRDVWLVGRLATDRYYNMDQVVGQALATFKRINQALASRAQLQFHQAPLAGSSAA